MSSNVIGNFSLLDMKKVGVAGIPLILDGALGNVIEMQQDSSLSKKTIVSICEKLERNSTIMERVLSGVVLIQRSKRENVENKLVLNREEYAGVCALINDKDNDINELDGKLSQLQSKLAGYKNQINDLNNDINQSEKKKRKAKRRRKFGIAVGVLTGGIVGGVVAGTVLNKNVQNKQSQLNSLNNIKNNTMNDISNTKDLKNLAQEEKDVLINEKFKLNVKQINLNDNSKLLGKKIVAINESISKISEARRKCISLKVNVDIIESLANDELFEYIQEPLKDLRNEINGAIRTFPKIDS